MDLEEPGAAYNVCSGRTVTIRQILEWIQDEAGVDLEIEVDPEKVREEEAPRLLGDPTRLREQTGWRPRHPVEETVREVYRSVAG